MTKLLPFSNCLELKQYTAKVENTDKIYLLKEEISICLPFE